MRRFFDQSAACGIALALICCGGSEEQRQKYGEAVMVAGIAATLQAVQVAKGQTQPPAAAAGAECCIVCPECSFPCGDECVPQGTLCTRPRGCACWQGQSRATDKPPENVSQPGCLEPYPSVTAE